MKILDTSAVIEVLHGTLKGKEIISKTESDAVGITSFTVYELYRGVNQEKGLVDFIGAVEILDFDAESARESAKIEKELKVEMINRIDILIAGICRANDLSIVTLDHDFKAIQSLDIILIE